MVRRHPCLSLVPAHLAKFGSSKPDVLQIPSPSDMEASCSAAAAVLVVLTNYISFPLQLFISRGFSISLVDLVTSRYWGLILVLVSAARLKSLAFAEGSALQSNCRDFEWEWPPRRSNHTGNRFRQPQEEPGRSSTVALVLRRFASPAQP